MKDLKIQVFIYIISYQDFLIKSEGHEQTKKKTTSKYNFFKLYSHEQARIKIFKLLLKQSNVIKPIYDDCSF